MTERNRIEIDYCPSCRGVWLDKGELDKMLEYTAQNIPYENTSQQDYYTQGPHNPHGNHPHGIISLTKRNRF